ncbi:hypothetical protein RFI_07621 [Reticulomyxa filosa]|uniref:CFA20 domain-containing protein n=1 Tax=Reticulomyxa filosa TaxID=46433 RepID=X6NT99_RETFI|nr:hypothetical protein RFI_07621 [Reticulomyxa filosa]|eukprot:ETO29500.1 hypothetical protein RFI_07621 [Reticulomyxa filosa]
MFKNTFQSGFLSILYSIGSKPLQIWEQQVKDGSIKRITDKDIQSSVIEILGANVSTCYIICPADPKKTLGIKLPFLVMIIKNIKKYFTFEVTVLDDKEIKRRFRASNYQKSTDVNPFICTMPMRFKSTPIAGFEGKTFNFINIINVAHFLFLILNCFFLYKNTNELPHFYEDFLKNKKYCSNFSIKNFSLSKILLYFLTKLLNKNERKQKYWKRLS